MNKYLIFFVVLILGSCKGDKTDDSPKNNLSANTVVLTKEKIAKIQFTDILLDDKAKVVAQNWTTYQTIETAIDQIKVLNFDFFNKDATEFDTTFKELNSNIPEAFDSQSIKARLLVLQTQLYRFKDELGFSPTLNTTHIKYVKAIFVAFSNLNLQINKKLEKEAQVIIKPE